MCIRDRCCCVVNFSNLFPLSSKHKTTLEVKVASFKCLFQTGHNAVQVVSCNFPSSAPIKMSCRSSGEPSVCFFASAWKPLLFVCPITQGLSRTSQNLLVSICVFFRPKWGLILHCHRAKWWQHLANRMLAKVSLSLIHIWRCRRSTLCRSRWSPYP